MERNICSVSLMAEDGRSNYDFVHQTSAKNVCRKVLLSNWAFKKLTVCGRLDTGTVRSQYWHCGDRKGHCKLFARQLAKVG